MTAPHPFLKSTADGVTIAVKVQPRAKRNGIVDVHGEELRIRIAAPPVDSAANSELVKFIAKLLGVSRSRVAIERGATSGHKLVSISGTSAMQVAAGIDAALIN